MNTTLKYILGGVALLVLVGGVILWNRSSVSEKSSYGDDTLMAPQGAFEDTPALDTSAQQTTPALTSAPSSSSSNSQNTVTTKTFTLAEVATHASSSDCYSAINDVVYDLTTWIKKHPGGSREILRICGKDGSSAFSGEHGGDARPEQILAGFEIGTLTQ